MTGSAPSNGGRSDLASLDLSHPVNPRGDKILRAARPYEEPRRISDQRAGESRDSALPVDLRQQRLQRGGSRPLSRNRLRGSQRDGGGIEHELCKRALIGHQNFTVRALTGQPGAPRPYVAVASLTRGELHTKAVTGDGRH